MLSHDRIETFPDYRNLVLAAIMKKDLTDGGTPTPSMPSVTLNMNAMKRLECILMHLWISCLHAIRVYLTYEILYVCLPVYLSVCLFLPLLPSDPVECHVKLFYLTSFSIVSFNLI